MLFDYTFKLFVEFLSLLFMFKNIYILSFVAMKKYCAFVHVLVNPLRGSDYVRRAQVKVPL